MSDHYTGIAERRRPVVKPQNAPPRSETIRLFLAGDVMLGRGIDQILPHPSDPVLHEGYMRSAKGYVELAEKRSGDIPRAVSFTYVWGDLLPDLEVRSCNLRLINLETAITTSDAAEPKGINYRIHPENAPALSAAGIDAVSLANNHTLDWGRAGLIETLEVLSECNITAVGAGRTQEDAHRPVPLELGNGRRLLVLAYGAQDSGIPVHWRADRATSGLNLLPETADDAIAEVRRELESVRKAEDLVLVSIHWGDNWGYEIPADQRALANRLIDEARVDIIHGHSSHHPKAVSPSKRREMIRKDNMKLSLTRQCRLLKISCSSIYYTPVGVNAETLALMHEIDRVFTKHPFFGSRQLAAYLPQSGFSSGRHRVRRLMNLMGLQAIYEGQNTSKKHPRHRIYPYLLRKLAITRPDQVWRSDITYIPVKSGFLYLVAIMDWATRKVLTWRLSNTLGASFCVEAL